MTRPRQFVCCAAREPARARRVLQPRRRGPRDHRGIDEQASSPEKGARLPPVRKQKEYRPMRKSRTAPSGEIRRFTIESKVLQGNLRGDPTARELRVYLPAGYDEARRYPLLVDLVGFTGSG